MAATIKDIARKLNISVSTVSYALNGGPRRVPAEVRERVLETARELQYRPNRVARSMITGKSQTIGVIPPEVTENAFLSPYLHSVMNGIANAAGQSHYDMLIYTRQRETESEHLLSVLVDGRVDAAIFIAPHYSHKTIELATSTHLPCVAISGAPLEGVASFTVNNEHGIHQAMQHLVDLGHRRIAHIAGREDMVDSELRLVAYRDFLIEAGIPVREEYIGHGHFQIEGGRSQMERLLRLPQPPTAVLCANDEMAIGALFQAHQRGISIPRDMSIVGFDMTPNSGHVYPPLTTVSQPLNQLSVAAVSSLLHFVNGGAPPSDTVLDSELVVRASTSRPKEDK